MNEKQQKAFMNLLAGFAGKMNINIGNKVAFTSRNDILYQINEINSEIYSALNDFQEQASTYFFVKNDSELRLKMEPVWISETKRLKANLAMAVNSISKLAERDGIDIKAMIENFN